MHAVAAHSDAYDPTKHCVQLPAAGAPDRVLYVPGPQAVQSVRDRIPVPVRYFPGVHRMQCIAPAPVLYVPEVQLVQLAEDCIPAPVWYVPDAHRVQLMAAGTPDPVLYVPGPHAVQLAGDCIPAPV